MNYKIGHLEKYFISDKHFIGGKHVEFEEIIKLISVGNFVVHIF